MYMYISLSNLRWLSPLLPPAVSASLTFASRMVYTRLVYSYYTCGRLAGVGGLVSESLLSESMVTAAGSFGFTYKIDDIFVRSIKLWNTCVIAPRMRKMDSPENFTSIIVNDNFSQTFFFVEKIFWKFEKIIFGKFVFRLSMEFLEFNPPCLVPDFGWWFSFEKKGGIPILSLPPLVW